MQPRARNLLRRDCSGCEAECRGALQHPSRAGRFESSQNDDAKHYVFSNVVDVASRSKPYEKVAVAKNLQYVIEAIRAEGSSAWMTCAHDEFVLVLDGEVAVEFVKLDRPERFVPPDKDGTVLVEGEPKGQRMGIVRLVRGHQALLPKGAAYRFVASRPSAMIQQTIKGDLTQEKWAEICAH